MVSSTEARARRANIKAELDALNKIVVLMEGADDDTRKRIMAYLNGRYPFYAWPIYERG